MRGIEHKQPPWEGRGVTSRLTWWFIFTICCCLTKYIIVICLVCSLAQLLLHPLFIIPANIITFIIFWLLSHHENHKVTSLMISVFSVALLPHTFWMNFVNNDAHFNWTLLINAYHWGLGKTHLMRNSYYYYFYIQLSSYLYLCNLHFNNIRLEDEPSDKWKKEAKNTIWQL